MKLTKEGLVFSYHGDILTWIWPWVGIGYYSNIYEKEFDNLRDYWYYVGEYDEICRKKKITGFSNWDILFEWIKYKFKNQIVVVLRDVSIEMKPSSFWKSVPQQYQQEILKDVCVFTFDDYDKAHKVAISIIPEFADVLLFVNGKVLYDNREDRNHPAWTNETTNNN